MMQQVNLYQRERHVAPRPTYAYALLGVVVSVLVVFALVYTSVHWQFEQVRLERVRSSEQRASLTKQKEALHQQLKQQRVSVALTAEKERLEREREAKRQVLSLLSGDAAGNQEGFSGHLEGLARRPVKGLWLTGIRIDAGGARLALSGSALEAELVPRYLQALSDEPAFAGHEFLTLNMERPEKDPGRLDFRLATRPEEGL
ncbi:MAG: hypothetical protein Kow006_13750 [Gammaproteobacteria bacterium]